MLRSDWLNVDQNQKVMDESIVISPSLLEKVNTSKPLDPAFDLGMADWISPEYAEKVKQYKEEKENELPPTKRRKLDLSLSKRFKDSVSPNSLKKAAEGVVPANTKLSNDWAVRNLKVWLLFCKQLQVS